MCAWNSPVGRRLLAADNDPSETRWMSSAFDPTTPDGRGRQSWIGPYSTHRDIWSQYKQVEQHWSDVAIWVAFHPLPLRFLTWQHVGLLNLNFISALARGTKKRKKRKHDFEDPAFIKHSDVGGRNTISPNYTLIRYVPLKHSHNNCTFMTDTERR